MLFMLNPYCYYLMFLMHFYPFFDYVLQIHVAAVEDPTNMEQNVAAPEDIIPNDDKTPTEETGDLVGGEEKTVILVMQLEENR